MEREYLVILTPDSTFFRPSRQDETRLEFKNDAVERDSAATIPSKLDGGSVVGSIGPDVPNGKEGGLQPADPKGE